MLGRFAFTNKLVAKSLGADEKRVESVMNFYVKELEQELKDCKHPYLYISGLGTFGLNQLAIENKLKYMIPVLRAHIRNRNVKEYKRRDQVIASTTREVFVLFEMRRLIRTRKKINKELRDAGKAMDDHKG